MANENTTVNNSATKPRNTVKLRSVISFVLVASFLFYEMAIQVSPGVMASSLLAELHFGAAWLGFAMSAYYYSYSLMMIPVGLLYDRLSAKKLLVFAVSLCVIGCALFANAHGPILLIFARFFTGLGSAFAFIGVLVVAARCFPNSYYAPLVGITQLLAAFGAMSGVTPIALSVARFGWRHSMLGIAAIGLVLILLLLFFLKSSCMSEPVAEKIAGVKAATKKQHSFKQSLLVVFKNPQTFWVAAYSFCAWAPVTFFASLWGVPYFMSRYHLANTKASFAIDMLWLGIAFAAPVLGWAVKRTGHRLLLIWAALIGMACGLGVLYLPHISFDLASVLCFGIGIAAAANILCFDLVNINNPVTEHAVAVGANNISLVVTGVILQPAVGLLMHWHAGTHLLNATGSALANYHVSDYLASLWLMPLCCFVGLLVALFAVRYPNSN